LRKCSAVTVGERAPRLEKAVWSRARRVIGKVEHYLGELFPRVGRRHRQARLAAAEGIEVNFWSYFRIGAPLTITTLVIGVLLL
jgi:hypothetical protein